MNRINNQSIPDTNTAAASKALLRRGICIGLAFVLAAGYLVTQLKRIQVDEYDNWRSRAVNQQMSTTEVAAERGAIYDANGNVLAQNVTVWTVDAAPDVLAQTKTTYLPDGTTDVARFVASQFAEVLQLSEDTLYANLSDSSKRYYRIKAKIDKPTADAIREIISEYGISGISLTQDTKRYYPYGDLAASVLGFVSDDGGAEGLENYYDSVLSGEPGRQISVVNARGEAMAVEDNESAYYSAQDGYNLVLTLNAEIQQIVEKYLAKAVTDHNASERGMAIAMNPQTGEIYAMATYPAYDPNDPYYIYDDATREALEAMPTSTEEELAAYTAAQGAARIKQWRNKAVADTYEPGSVLKIVTAAAAIDSGTFTINSTFTCTSAIQVADTIMSCAGDPPTAHGTIPLSEALIESCNVSFITMALAMGKTTWYDYINAFGLTEPTGVDLPGEPSAAAISSLIYSEEAMGLVELASASFGQSNKYSALQMITAVSAAVNGGHLMQPYIVSAITDSDGNIVESFSPVEKRQVISSETSAQLADTLEHLVSDTSNGKNAYVAGYHVGGKSGTSQKLERYTQDGESVYLSSFLGFAPSDDPQIAVLFVLDEPDDSSGYGTWFGGRLAGPSVGSIISEAMPVLGVSPDYASNDELLRTYTSTPNLVGQTLEKARVLLNQEGLSYIVEGSGDTVVAQYPEASSEVPFAGQVILYTESAGGQTVTVPSLVGLSASAARSTLRDLGLNVMTTGAPESEGTTVTVQDVEAGTAVLKGATITLTLEDQSVVAE